MKHDDYAPTVPLAKAPWWMDGETLPLTPKEPMFLIRGLRVFWQKLTQVLLFPLSQQDPLTCHIQVLHLLAWERGVKQLYQEPDALFRTRVKYAWANYQDAGSAIGFKQIFERLGLGHVTIKQRQPNTDWDVITIELSDNAISENQALVATIIQLYGRTCRRYRYEVTHHASIQIYAGCIHFTHDVYVAN
ncbi:phage tail protein [Shewanella sp. D64]|uniref:phage tail protein n=1 Tax=unclassified Shewanella TaxID=196818 RepID=UPI0022BA1ED2|nr:MULTISPECIES: phage tail protein [unclassified Shewanella]MEC4725860.1 phage tail protein [Shewanella sp. D64]MEC4737115.1 phage tail protein [Shewanella sp. E94]WBJ93570.1 phage tail protein [Shewanella sp. MTB7]WBJ95693.1 phage tail protein [Shewanella sp. MTB7]